MAEKKQLKLNSPFCNDDNVQWEGQKDFDTTYKSIAIIDKVKKVGEGDQDFIIEKVVEVTETPIQEVIDADKESVGVYNIIKQVMRTGDTSLLPADKGDCNVDMVGAPETLMEVKAMGQAAEKKFGSLPEDLTKGMDMASFVNSLTQEQFDAFVKGIADRAAKKEGESNE